MAWLNLFIAGLMEIAWVLGMKFSQGFTRFLPSAATVIAMTLSMYFLSRALRTIPIGTGYAVWTGIGAAGTAIIGAAFLGEPRTLVRLLCIFLIILAIAGLKFFSE